MTSPTATCSRCHKNRNELGLYRMSDGTRQCFACIWPQGKRWVYSSPIGWK